MKAIIAREYGPADVLRYEDVPVPQPAGNEVQVRVHRVSLNSTDTEMLAGRPFFVRLGGLRAPMAPIPGSDVAGQVTAVGPDAAAFRAGDWVFGDLSASNFGGLAEVVVAPETLLAPLPDGLSLDDAAALPQAGVLALQGLRDYGRVREGQFVLVNGASGGVGTFAVQIAKLAGATVMAVDHGDKLALLRSIGADDTLDYTRWEYTRNKQRYDIILDTVAARSMFAYQRVLRPGGAFVMVGGRTGVMLQAVTLGPALAWLNGQKIGLLMGRSSVDDLRWLAERVLAGQITPVIGSRYPLHQAADAFRELAAGRVLGKVVVAVVAEG